MKLNKKFLLAIPVLVYFASFTYFVFVKLYSAPEEEQEALYSRVGKSALIGFVATGATVALAIASFYLYRWTSKVPFSSNEKQSSISLGNGNSLDDILKEMKSNGISKSGSSSSSDPGDTESYLKTLRENK